MCRLGIVPYNSFLVRIPAEEVHKRTAARAHADFECNRTIVAKRVRYLQENLPLVSALYQKLYNSLLEIDGLKSKWYMEDRALSAIEDTLSAR
jgi:hypothetical protein